VFFFLQGFSSAKDPRHAGAFWVTKVQIMVLYMRMWLNVDLLEDPDAYLFRHSLFTHQQVDEPDRKFNNTMYDFVYSRVGKALKELGLPQYGLHSLRKGRSIELRLAGGLEAVIERTCHSQNSLTAIRTYANVQNAVIGQRAIGQVVSPLLLGGQAPTSAPAPVPAPDLAEMPFLTASSDADMDAWFFEDSVSVDLFNPLGGGVEMARAQLEAAATIPTAPSERWTPPTNDRRPPPPPPPPPKKQKMTIAEVRPRV